jgi:AraC family carnitine catabolism transcriptional activator
MVRIMAHVSFILCPRFPMLAYALAREVLEIANEIEGAPLFTWDTRIPGHTEADASNGAVMAPDRRDWNGADQVDLALVICGDTLPARIPNGFQTFLAQIDQTGGRLGGVATGALILARIGHLDGRRAVVKRHPGHEADDTLAGIAISDRPHVLDDRRLTVVGGTAVATALCAWIAGIATPALAEEVSRALSTGRMPDLPNASTADTEPETASADPVIAMMEQQMRAHLAAPLPLSDLADALGLSRKALRGRCVRALGVKPSDHYLALRLKHGADLLRHTAMPVSEIAREAGFETLAGFSRSVRNNLGVSPSAMRKMARAARMVTIYA